MAEQAGLSLTWSYTPKTDFLVTRLKVSRDMAQLQPVAPSSELSSTVTYEYQCGYLYFAERNGTKQNKIPVVLNAVVKFKEK